MSKNVYICGVANSGKTTLYNTLTGKNERVGNWYGVTTNAVNCVIKRGKRQLKITDLPGSYLDSYTLESQVVLNNIDKNGVIIVVCEAVNLQKGLNFLKGIAQFNNKIVFVVNFYSEFKKSGGYINFCLLKRLIGVDVVCAECNDKNDVKNILSAVNRLIDGDFIPIRQFNTQQIMKLSYKNSRALKLSLLDELLLCPAVSFAAFALFSLTGIYLAFGKYGIGTLLAKATEKMLEYAVNQPIARLLTKIGANNFIKGFICEGLLGGFSSVLVFLPRLAVLSLFSSFIEESGVLSRMAFSLNGFLSFFGLSGRALFALFSGYGCTAVAVLATNGLENKVVKRHTLLCLPFISCSAKVPVYLYIASLIGAKYAFSFVIIIYVVGIFSALGFSLMLKAAQNLPKSSLIIELPPLRIPHYKSLLKTLQNFIKSFIIKIGCVITVVTAFLWLLKSLSPQMQYLSDANVTDSLLVHAANAFSFIFAPIGYTDWQLTAAAIVGLFAKESIVAAIALLGTGSATSLQLMAFLVFCSLYPPCLTALATIAKEGGMGPLLHVLCFQTVLALLCCYSVKSAFYILPLTVLVVVVFVVIKIKKSKSRVCFNKCGDCTNGKICHTKRAKNN